MRSVTARSSGITIEPVVKGVRALAHRLVEKLLLAADVRVERALLDSERLREIAHGGPVIALLCKEPGGVA